MNIFQKTDKNNPDKVKRVIAVLTDVHGMFEPLEAVLNDIYKQGITEIYSLGDNIGDGPNPLEVMQLLEQYNVKLIAGNAEDYLTLGPAPFVSYLNKQKQLNSLWTKQHLTGHELGIIELLPRSIELILGGKTLALCHFANDVRIDFGTRSTWTYQNGFNFQIDGSRKKECEKISEQFKYTNSFMQKKEIKKHITNLACDRGYVSAYHNPIFNGKKVEKFDTIIQGHVHWKLKDLGKNNSTDFYTIRAVGMGYRPLEYPEKQIADVYSEASYVIIREFENGFSEPEERLVVYDREKLIYNILKCDNPYTPIKKYVCITDEELNKFKIK